MAGIRVVKFDIRCRIIVAPYIYYIISITSDFKFLQHPGFGNSFSLQRDHKERLALALFFTRFVPDPFHLF